MSDASNPNNIHRLIPNLNTVVEQLEAVIRMIKEQEEEVFRWKYYSEANGIIMTLIWINYFDQGEAKRWRDKMKDAFNKSLEHPNSEDSGRRPLPRWD